MRAKADKLLAAKQGAFAAVQKDRVKAVRHMTEARRLVLIFHAFKIVQHACISQTMWSFVHPGATNPGGLQQSSYDALQASLLAIDTNPGGGGGGGGLLGCIVLWSKQQCRSD